MHSVLILGCGNIAGGFDANRAVDKPPLTHAGAYARDPRFTIAACIDPDEARRSAFQKRWQVSDAADSLDAFGAEVGRFAVVSICSPTSFHRDHIETVLALKPRLIFCEKPLSCSSQETRYVAERCAGAGIRLAVNYTRRWDPVVTGLAEDIRAGLWGAIRSASGVYTKGVVHNGSHMADLLHLLLGEIDLVAAGPPVFDFWDADPSVPALLISATGVPVALTPGHAGDYALFELTLVTERGTISLLDGGRRWTMSKARESEVFAGYRSLGEPESHEGGYDQAMSAAVANIADALDHDAPLASTAVNALAAQQLCERIRDSALASSTPLPKRTVP